MFGLRFHRRIVSGNGTGIGQILHIGVLDQLLGAHSGAQAAVGALGVVNDSQVVGDGDGTLGADLLAQAAADTAYGTAADSDSTLLPGRHRR